MEKKNLLNLIKKISVKIGLPILFGITLVSCVSLNSTRTYYHKIPAFYKNYREKAIKIAEGIGSTPNEIPIYLKFYHLHNDEIADVGELYDMPYIEGNEPAVYGFDIDRNGHFEDNELYYDEKRDGFNGNEIRQDKNNKKTT